MRGADEGIAPELIAALDDNPDARKIFDALPPSQRRRYSDHVTEAVDPQARAARAAKRVQRIHATESAT